MEQDLDDFDLAMYDYQLDSNFNEKIDDDLDYAFALTLQWQLEEESKVGKTISDYGTEKNETDKSHFKNLKSKNSKVAQSLVDDEWEILDPNPDIHALFLQFNAEYFWGTLEGVEVKWSPRMTLCAGVCCYEGRGGLCSVRLSLPLLRYRPRKDLVETLLHEMIHAYLFVTHNNRDHNAHGPEFIKHMSRINQMSGTKITVYHSFHDEVDFYRKHLWKCNGPCQKWPPFYGIVKRAMNRAPSKNDTWWNDHMTRCGGTFIKISEPEKNAKKLPLKRNHSSAISPVKNEKMDIRNFLSSPASGVKNENIKTFANNCAGPSSSKKEQDLSKTVPFSGKGYTLGTLSVQNGNESVQKKKNRFTDFKKPENSVKSKVHFGNHLNDTLEKSSMSCQNVASSDSKDYKNSNQMNGKNGNNALNRTILHAEIKKKSCR